MLLLSLLGGWDFIAYTSTNKVVETDIIGL
jgi:hypothetical protein